MDGLLADRLFNPLKPDRHFYVSPGLAPAEAEASVGRGILAGDCSGTPANPTKIEASRAGSRREPARANKRIGSPHGCSDPRRPRSLHATQKLSRLL